MFTKRPLSFFLARVQSDIAIKIDDVHYITAETAIDAKSDIFYFSLFHEKTFFCQKKLDFSLRRKTFPGKGETVISAIFDRADRGKP